MIRRRSYSQSPIRSVYARVLYKALLSKTILWAPEEEIRFLSKSQWREQET